MERTTCGDYVSLRNEIKYVVPLEKAIAVNHRLESLLQKDAYSRDGYYSVRSVYFESVNNIDFNDKIAGIDSRKKLRIRIYNNDASVCKLEIKQKNGNLQQKHSLLISAADAGELLYGNYSVLKNYFADSETSLRAYAIMARGCYRPVVQIEYDRYAYKYPMYDTRITLDMNVRTSESNMDIFASDINYIPILHEEAVLELKYSGKLMGFISSMLSEFNLTQESYSKYCSGRKVYYDFNY